MGYLTTDGEDRLRAYLDSEDFQKSYLDRFNKDYKDIESIMNRFLETSKEDHADTVRMESLISDFDFVYNSIINELYTREPDADLMHLTSFVNIQRSWLYIHKLYREYKAMINR